MKHALPDLRFPRRAMAAMAMISMAFGISAQQPNSDTVEAQRQAMQKLAFLAGRWSGPVTIALGPGDPLRLTQAENVRFKLDGLVLLIEGQSAGADGTAQFQALATVAYDETTRTYRIRAYNAGRYLDTELNVLADGFSWGFNSGPAHIQNAMHLTARGEWQESTDVTFGSNPPHRSVDMLLQHQP